MSLFTTYLEQVKTEMNPDEMALKKLAMEIIGFNPNELEHTNDLSWKENEPDFLNYMKFLQFKLAIKTHKLNTIQVWNNFLEFVFGEGDLDIEDNETLEDTYEKVLEKLNAPESEIKRAKRIFDDKFIEDNKIPFFIKLAEEKTNNKQLIKKVIKDIWG